MPRACAVVVSMLLASGCATPPVEHRLAPLYRSVRALDGAAEVGVNMLRLSELLQGAAAQMVIANDLVLDNDEAAVLKSYAVALAAYKAVSDKWQEQNAQAGKNWDNEWVQSQNRQALSAAFTEARKASDAAAKGFLALQTKR